MRYKEQKLKISFSTNPLVFVSSIIGEKNRFNRYGSHSSYRQSGFSGPPAELGKSIVRVSWAGRYNDGGHAMVFVESHAMNEAKSATTSRAGGMRIATLLGSLNFGFYSVVMTSQNALKPPFASFPRRWWFDRLTTLSKVEG